MNKLKTNEGLKQMEIMKENGSLVGREEEKGLFMRDMYLYRIKFKKS